MKKAVYSVFLISVLSVFSIFRLNVAYIYELESEQKTSNLESSDTLNKMAVPVIYHPDKIDRDFDGIADSLEYTLFSADQAQAVSVIVTLYNPVESQDLEHFTFFGGSITYVYRYITYGFAGSIPASNVSSFAAAEGENLVIIEPNLPIKYHLDVSVPLIRVRPTVWQTYRYNGSANHSIAILDTGIDDSHLDLGPYGNQDFSKKIVGWHDATLDGTTTPVDKGEHGTHVAGIAASTGAANTLQGSGTVTTTFTWFFPSVLWGYLDYIDVKVPGIINLSLSWSGTNTALVQLSDPAGTLVAEESRGYRRQPLTITYDTTGKAYPTGRYCVGVFNGAGSSGSPFSLKETYPYQGLNDGYNLFRGVAPNSKLVGVKVFDNTGSGTSETVFAGMDWVVKNRLTYNITVVNMSLGLENGGVNSTIDQKADTMVQNGIVTVVSAGNDYQKGFTIGSPGTAAYVITVAATNDQNGITDYSSNGDTAKNEFNLIKPDVAAPGGTFQPQYGNLIISTDSNDVDAAYSGYADKNANDYQQMGGTSMSAPHVSGLAALITQAFGSWSWTLEEALKVKMLISMTAFETQNGEGGNVPPLNRGDKDNKEGYGRISADAAIEAATMIYNVKTLANDILGSNPSDKKVWARQVSLSAGNEYEFRLSTPSSTDYDLYLYNGSPDTYGQPIVLNKSVNTTTGTTEVVKYTPSNSGSHYIVVKWVSGSGQFTLESTVKIPGDANGDSSVNMTDLSLVEQAFGSTPTSGNWRLGCDFNRDDIINVLDLHILGKNYGKTV